MTNCKVCRTRIESIKDRDGNIIQQEKPAMMLHRPGSSTIEGVYCLTCYDNLPTSAPWLADANRLGRGYIINMETGEKIRFTQWKKGGKG